MLILDTDIASAFAKAGHFDALISLFRSVGITTSVYEELLTPIVYGYGYPRTIFGIRQLQLHDCINTAENEL